MINFIDQLSGNTFTGECIVKTRMTFNFRMKHTKYPNIVENVIYINNNGDNAKLDVEHDVLVIMYNTKSCRDDYGLVTSKITEEEFLSEFRQVPTVSLF